MREILFRGKRVDNGEWIDGFYAHSGERTYIIVDNDIAVAYVTMKEVSPETIGQFTGLTDENGKRIFEGDIIYGAAYWLERFVSAVVAFCNGSFGLRWYRGNVEEFNPFTSLCNITYEVIGNIHDNPELLR